jgi:hypothetical protein
VDSVELADADTEEEEELANDMFEQSIDNSIDEETEKEEDDELANNLFEHPNGNSVDENPGEKDEESSSENDSTNQNLVKKPKKKSKQAVARDPNLVYSSLVKNSYALGEFFLIKYQHNDSAKAAYKYFVNNFQDSLLTPKAYYSLYYIYNLEDSESIMADSLKNLILSNYPQSVYAQKFNVEGSQVQVDYNPNDVLAESMYLEAENLIESGAYYTALEKLEMITDLDSSSSWSAKSRYAMAYVFENYLEDVESAVENYTIIARDYPNTKYHSIAKNKIKEPPPEVISAPLDTTITEFSGSSLDVSDSTFVQQFFENVTDSTIVNQPLENVNDEKIIQEDNPVEDKKISDERVNTNTKENEIKKEIPKLDK